MTARRGLRPAGSRYALRLLPWSLVGIGVIVALGLLMIPRSTGGTRPVILGLELKKRPPAPLFQLHDQFGRSISLRQFRGHPVIITFLAATCATTCPVVAETIRRSVAELGSDGKPVAILALSTDPEGDTRQLVRSFSQQHGLYYRWHYLSGPRNRLAPIWRAYYVYAAPAHAPAAVRDSHTSVTYLIDARGRERVLLTNDPGTTDLQQDLQIIAGLPVSPVGDQLRPAPQIGHPAPEFVLKNLHGATVRLTSLRGKVVLLNFWATWCMPCRSEAPLLSSWYRRLYGRGLVVLGVDQQEGVTDVVPFVQQHSLSYPIVLDEKGNTGAIYDVPDLPKSLVIDRGGIVRAIALGAVDDAFIAAQVRPLLSP